MKPLHAILTLALAAAAACTSAQAQQTTYPDLAVDLIGPGTLQIGRSDRYLLKVTNHGSQVAANAVAVITLPAGMGLYRSTPPTGCTWNAGLRTVSCAFASLAVNTTSTVRINLTSIGTAPSIEQVRVAASVPGEPAASMADNTDMASTHIGSFSPVLTFPTAQAFYLCNGNKDILSASCNAVESAYGAHGSVTFDATGTYRFPSGPSAGAAFVARQLSNTSLAVDLWTADGRNTVLWDLTPQSATCWQGSAYRLDNGSVFYEVRMCQP
jgi:hypothetical protein